MTHSSAIRTAPCLLPFVVAAGVLSGCAGRTSPPATAPAARPATVAAPPAVAAPTAPAPATAVSAARPPAPAPLVGHVTRAALEDYETWKTLRAQDYTPDAAAVKAIAERGRDVAVLAIVATWCPDSKREVPRFFKIYDRAGIDLARVTMVSVDRTKKDAEGLTEKHQVLRVPTFVFFRGGREIGRVTERAVTTLEADIAAIVAK
jgi:thiol-disulfide isomerase/thioredoxin